MSEATLTLGSLFAGIGGLDLGLERAGMELRWQAEVDPFCTGVLERHWPDVARYGDVSGVDWTEVERVDVICGGFPCQPVSIAGRRQGQDDGRWLWPEYARCLRVLRPRYAIVENVPGLLAANRGDAMGEVLGDLAACGYDAEWDCVSAAAVGAPHLRDRVWIVASRTEQPRALAHAGGGRGPDDELRAGRDEPGASSTDVADAVSVTAGPRREGDTKQGTRGRDSDRSGLGEDEVADADTQRRQGCRLPEGVGGPSVLHPSGRGSSGGRQGVRPGGEWPPEPALDRVADGVPTRLDRARIATLGNAVVPQVAEWVGRAVVAHAQQTEGAPDV